MLPPSEEQRKPLRDSLQKPQPVDLLVLGRVFVRPRFMQERDAAEAAYQVGDIDQTSWGLSGLLCEPTGERLTLEHREAWAKAFVDDLLQSDVVAISQAADEPERLKPAEPVPGN